MKALILSNAGLRDMGHFSINFERKEALETILSMCILNFKLQSSVTEPVDGNDCFSIEYFEVLLEPLRLVCRCRTLHLPGAIFSCKISDH